MDENLLLEHKLIEIDYCKPVPGGLLIYLSGQIMNGKPVGIWKKFDHENQLMIELSGTELDNYLYPYGVSI